MGGTGLGPAIARESAILMGGDALDRAHEGVYSEPQAQVLARNYHASGGKSDFDDYCSSGFGRIIVRESLRKNIVFFQHSLVPTTRLVKCT